MTAFCGHLVLLVCSPSCFLHFQISIQPCYLPSSHLLLFAYFFLHCLSSHRKKDMRKDCDATYPLRSGEPSREPDQPIQLRSHEFVDQPSVAKQLYLPIKDWQTRVLILHNGPFNSPLVADLVTVDLIWSPGVVIHDTQEKIQYTALSYTWGAPDFSQRLVVNGFQCSIAENLFRYLQRRRQRLQTLALWVDAICINQHDNAEGPCKSRVCFTSTKKQSRQTYGWARLGQAPTLQWNISAGRARMILLIVLSSTQHNAVAGR